MTKGFIPIAKVVLSNDEIRTVVEVLKSGRLRQGKKTDKFERAFAEKVRTRYAVAVGSCPGDGRCSNFFRILARRCRNSSLSCSRLSKWNTRMLRSISSQQGKIPAIKIGRFWRFKKEDIDKWLGKRVSQLDPGADL